MNYYNEFDPHAATWLQGLIDEKLIPPGKIDTRSISDVSPNDLSGFTQCHFFCGIAGWVLALELAGWPTDRPVWTGSCPCQPFSAAGKGKGADDERHLWPIWFNLIRQCRPPVVFGEQVERAIRHGWADEVASDLEGEDYAFVPVVLGAYSVEADHARPRLYFAADTERHQQPWKESCFGSPGRVGWKLQSLPWDEPWESALSRFRTLGDGLPRCVAATDGARNAIVPQVAAEFIAAYLDTERSIA